MGNQVRCEVVFKHCDLAVLFGAFAVTTSEKPLSLALWVPPPPNLVHPYQRSRCALLDLCGEQLDLDTWCRANWGVRGDAYGFSLEKQVREDEGWDARGSHFTVRFTTEWSAPLPVFVAMARLHCDSAASSVTALWYEEYGQTAGHLHFAFEEAPWGSKTYPSAVEVVDVGNYAAGEGCPARVQGYPGLAQCRALPWQPADTGLAGNVHSYLTYLRDRLWPTAAGEDAVPVLVGPDGRRQ